MKKRSVSEHLDTSRRFIHLRQLRDDGFVEFDFAIGDPELSVELILPRSAYEAFRNHPETTVLNDADFSRTTEKLQHYLYGLS